MPHCRAKELELEDRQARLQATFRECSTRPGKAFTCLFLSSFTAPLPSSLLSQIEFYLVFLSDLFSCLVPLWPSVFFCASCDSV